MELIKIKNLRVSASGEEILRGINLTVKSGETHALMGPNGSGKSTLAKALAGHPDLTVTSGSVEYNINGKLCDLLQLEPHQRAIEGMFLGFQYPLEIEGITNLNFLHQSFNALCKGQGAALVEEEEFRLSLSSKLEMLQIEPAFLDRSINVGFSGGEKKKNEILQMATFNPRLAILDETDSGLDIDSLKIVARGINTLKGPHNAFILVTHYQRILDHIAPDFVHIIDRGEIVKSGTRQLAKELEAGGYGQVRP